MKCTPTKWLQFTSQVMDGLKSRQQTLGRKDGWATLAKEAKKKGWGKNEVKAGNGQL